MEERGREAATNEKKRPRVEQDQQPPPMLSLSIKSQDGDQVFYRFVRTKKLRKLFSDYCKTKGVNYQTVEFLYHGQRIKSTTTLNEIGMEDGEQIDAMLHQHGGGNALINPYN